MPGDPHNRSKVWAAPDRAIGESGKYRRQVVASGDSHPAAAFHNRENCCNLGFRLCTAEVYPVLPAQGHWTLGIFCEVIAQLKFRIFRESREFPP